MLHRVSSSSAGIALVLALLAACGDDSTSGAGGGASAASGGGSDSTSSGGSDTGGSGPSGSNVGGSGAGSDAGGFGAGSDVGGSDVGSGAAGGGDAGAGGDGSGGSLAVPPDLCADYADVVMFPEPPYDDYTRRTTAAQGGFPPDRVFVMPMTLAATPTSYAAAGYTSMAEYQGPPTPRHMTLSRSPCDFRPVDPTGENGPLAESGGTATLINWNVGAEPLALVAGETYYFNYRNTNCAQASCDASTSTNWPH